MKRTTAAVATLALLCASTLAFLSIRSCTRIAEDTASQPARLIDTATNLATRAVLWPERAAASVRDLLQASVRVENTSIVLDREHIAELAVLQRKILCVTKHESTNLGFYAVAIVQGEFTVKCGYDLKKGCNIILDESNRVVRISLPPVQVLSVQTDRQFLLYHDDNFMNRLGPAEIEHVMRTNRESAHEQARAIGIAEETSGRLRERAADLFRGVADTVVIDDAPIQPPPLELRPRRD